MPVPFLLNRLQDMQLSHLELTGSSSAWEASRILQSVGTPVVGRTDVRPVLGARLEPLSACQSTHAMTAQVRNGNLQGCSHCPGILVWHSILAGPP